MPILYPLNDPSIRGDLRKIKNNIRLALYKWVKSFSPLPKISSGDQLHIACGPLVREGWVNVDIRPTAGAYYIDAEKGLPFEDSIFRHIHCEHFLEHLEQEQAIKIIAECFRVLQPGGSIRMIVPDAEKYFSAYTSGDTEYFKQLEYLGGSKEALRTPCEIINRMFRMWGEHRFAWDYETLLLYMSEAGFEKIVLSSPNDIAPEYDIDGDDWWREVESLYINAQKPA